MIQQKINKKIGIDISSHNGNIDLARIKAKNQLDFVIIRVGYGVKGTIDNKFKRNVALCQELDIPYGFYWYSYALDIDGANKEAYAFLNAIAPYSPTMGCWFDMEDADGYKKKNGMPTNQMLQDICDEFCYLVENAGYHAGIYASQSWFNNQLASDKLAKYDKWVAQWPTQNGKQKALSVNQNARPRSDASLWQFTSEGEFDGYNGGLDTNYAYNEFIKQPSELTTVPTPAPTPTPEGTTLELVIKVMKGEYGDGDRRKETLGTRYEEVQNFINHIYTASVDTLAKEVTEENKYGSGDVRKLVLGDRYEAVQAKVNELINNAKIVKGVKVRFTGTKSYSGLHLADWTHNDTFNVIEVSGNRVVIGKGSVVTAAVNIKDCELIK